MEKKKQWVQPELIVLTRSKPEEAVLQGCKWSSGDHGSEPDLANEACIQYDFGGPCGWCSAPSES